MVDLPPEVRWPIAVIAGGGIAGITKLSTAVIRAKSAAMTGGLANPVSVLATNLGFPRIGLDRELKKALESYWQGLSSKEALLHSGAQLHATLAVAAGRGIGSCPFERFLFLRSDPRSELHARLRPAPLWLDGRRSRPQIHTHMCYSEFNDIMPAIAAMDADVISIETSRSQMELLNAFVDYRYPNEIGPGVYDIHSPRVPTVEEMTALLLKARGVLSVEQLWVNPDCGLKTRAWPEVERALENMVAAARLARQELAKQSV